MATVYLSLGSNLGEREANIRNALNRLSQYQNIRIQDVSSLYETASVGYTDQPDFINIAVRIETAISPMELFYACVEIESEMGRVRNFHLEPRVIDIDILLCDNVVMHTPELTIPHPRMMERAFVMAPLAEIAPDLILPGGKTPGEILIILKDQRIRKLAEVK